ncbi:hypothetical protein [Acinetobacter larvae]|uniref:Internalin n=1 Tax=Acinetobacter larvae TaxID=1789224 RepID=A0A1B2LYL3_9GAMM|nr:hypothetical protein [Acinetobacter larvae]AOA58016.1 hypothetical protein BFG52_06390 [Acinetobacter larvae]
MKFKVLIAALCIAPLALMACSKQDKTPAAGQSSSEVEVVVETTEQITPQQQAAIDAIDKPELDEKNTDVPAEKANAPAEPATAADESEAAAH